MAEVFDDLHRQVSGLDTLPDGSLRYTFQKMDERGTNGDPRAQALDAPITRQDIIGKGAYGTVVRAYDRLTAKNVAIKKIGWHVILREVRRVLREVQVLKHCQHPNLITLRALYAVDADDEVTSPAQHNAQPYSLFIVCQLMDMPLAQLIQNQKETWERHGEKRWDYALKHARWLVHQMLHGIHGLHSAGVVHRDIKPQNLLVNVSDTRLKICDFGLSRASKPDAANVSHYVVTRLYRAPELIYGTLSLEKAIDIWSAGCVAGELLTCAPLFNVQTTYSDGKYSGQRASIALLRLLNRLGKPCDEDIAAVPHSNVREFLAKITDQHLEKKSLKRDVKEHLRGNLRIPLGDCREEDLAAMIDLVDCSLQFCPAKRPSAADLMQHEVFHFKGSERPEDCLEFREQEATEQPGFTVTKGLEMLRELVEEPVATADSSDDDTEDEEQEDDGAGRILEFLSLCYAGEPPPPPLWNILLLRHDALVKPTLEDMGLSHLVEERRFHSLTPEQLLTLGGRLGHAMQSGALEWLNSQELIAHPVTAENVSEMKPVIYATLNTIPSSNHEQEVIANAIRINVDFLIYYNNLLTRGGLTSQAADWSFARDAQEQQDELEGEEEDWNL